MGEHFYEYEKEVVDGVQVGRHRHTGENEISRMHEDAYGLPDGSQGLDVRKARTGGAPETASELLI